MVRIGTDRLDSSVGSQLASALMAELRARYGADDEPDGLHADQLAPPGGAFFVAWRDDRPVGTGGLRRVDDEVGEIKRMYVIPGARRSGVARAILHAIEARATSLGYQRLILETGTMQPEAIGLYTAHGYEPITPYGVYRDSPLSRCYAKSLG
jgi:GNAT superfamily N-acetyltransferase